MPCEECHGRCCRKFIVFITIQDVARILKAIPQMDPTYFMNPYQSDDIESNFPILKIKDKDYRLGLDSKQGEMRECIFLTNVGNTRICGIHTNRPLPCRNYPFKLNRGKLDSAEGSLCPKQWFPEGEERKEYTNNLNQFDKDFKEYEKIVEIWNRNFGEGGSFVEFLNFALDKVKI